MHSSADASTTRNGEVTVMVIEVPVIVAVASLPAPVEELHPQTQVSRPTSADLPDPGFAKVEQPDQ